MLVYFFRIEKIRPPLNQYSQLEEMLALRKLGYSFSALADRFKVPKMTIRYLCRRFGLSENNVEVTHFREPIRTPRKGAEVYHDEMDEPLNPGKSYAEYLQDQKNRKWRRLTQKH